MIVFQFAALVMMSCVWYYQHKILRGILKIPYLKK